MAKKFSHVKQKPEKESKHIKAVKEPKMPKKPATIKEKNSDTLLLLRLVLSTVLFAVSLVLDIPDLLSIALLVLSALVSGYDIFISAAKEIENKEIFGTSVIILLVTAISFVIGFGMEGAALVILYQIGLWLISYASERSKKSALDLLKYQDEDAVNRVKEILSSDEAVYMELESVMKQSSSLVLKFAMIIAVIYAAALPLATSFSYTVSIHRALTIILIANPVSVIAAMPITAFTGICYSASQGVIFNSARIMEKLRLTNIAVFDKAGVFAEKTPRVLEMQSDIVDQRTLMNFAAHALYYSEQPVAKAVSAINDQEYKLDVISDFVDVPGKGVSLKIGGTPVVLATAEFLMNMGVDIPNGTNEYGQTYYLAVSNRYVGRIVISSGIDDLTAYVSPELKEQGIKRLILLTEDGAAESQRVADELEFKEYYGECGTEKKLNLINNLKEGSRNHIAYIYSNGIESHSAADVDIRVSQKAKYADAIVTPGNVANIPFAFQVCDRTKEVSIFNAVFAFTIKAILIFLSIIGFCNVWFAIFIDMVAALATIINSVRVTQNSFVKSFRYKAGK